MSCQLVGDDMSVQIGMASDPATAAEKVHGVSWIQSPFPPWSTMDCQSLQCCSGVFLAGRFVENRGVNSIWRAIYHDRQVIQGAYRTQRS
jgi:hypothetical protein